MGNSLEGRRRQLLLAVAVLLLLSACSRVNLAYQHLDTLIPWMLDDYLDMSASQQSRVKAQLREHQAWHCHTQLPVYLDGLERLQREAREPRVESQTLRAHYRNMQHAIGVIAERISPSAIELLGDLDARQLDYLRSTLEEKHQELHEEFVEPPLPRQIRDRAERMQERIEHWSGPLDAAQRQRILQWAHALGEQNHRWLDNRRHWQALLIEALEQRQQADFPTRLSSLIQQPQAFWTEPYRASLAHNEEATLGLISDLHAMASAAQRNRLDRRLQDLRDDLSSLKCLPDSVG